MSDRLTVKAQVDETDISQIKLRGSAEIVLDAYPDQKIKAIADQIAFDAKTINNVTKYIVDVLPEKSPDFMRSGMTANVTFFIESKNGVLLIPNEAIKVREGQTTVNLRSPDGKEKVQDIQVGLSDGKNTEILSGLKEGDVVQVVEVKLIQNKNKTSNPFSPMGRQTRPR
jgi:macrolide-specific efflux system membrane fusion protein